MKEYIKHHWNIVSKDINIKRGKGRERNDFFFNEETYFSNTKFGLYLYPDLDKPARKTYFLNNVCMFIVILRIMK